MVSIFTSQKKLVIETQTDPQILLQKFRDRIGEDNFLSRLKSSFSRKGQYVGKIDGRTVEVEYRTNIRNSLQPKMHIQVETAPANGTLISTRFTTSIFVKIFLLVWMSFASLATIMIFFGTPDGAVLTPKALILGFPMFAVFLVVIMRIVARRDEKKLEWLVCDVVETCEAEQRGERLSTKIDKKVF